MSSRVKALENRLNQLGSKDFYCGLGTREYEYVSTLWHDLHWRPEERDELARLEKREKECQQVYDDDHDEWPEWARLETLRLHAKMHALRERVSLRTNRTFPLQKQVFPLIAPRMIRYALLDGPRVADYFIKSGERKRTLTDAEQREVRELEGWFDRLNKEILKSLDNHTELKIPR